MTYDELRYRYKPSHVRVLFIAESPPPSDTNMPSSRHFYRSDMPRTGDRLFTNTIKALYPEAADQTEAVIEQQKEAWLQRFSNDGYFMIEALTESQVHEVTKKDRQKKIHEHIDELITRVKTIASPDTKIILIKSNVFEVAAEPLKAASFNVLNTKLVDYPGQYNQRAYREKVAQLLRIGA